MAKGDSLFLISFDTKKLAVRDVMIWEEGMCNRSETTFLEKIKLLGKQKLIMMTSFSYERDPS